MVPHNFIALLDKIYAEPRRCPGCEVTLAVLYWINAIGAFDVGLDAAMPRSTELYTVHWSSLKILYCLYCVIELCFSLHPGHPTNIHLAQVLLRSRLSNETVHL